MSSLSDFSSAEGLSTPFDLHRDDLHFPKEVTISSGLLDINSHGGFLAAKSSSLLMPALARHALFPLGDAPLLSYYFTDNELKVLFSFSHVRYLNDETSLDGEEQYIVARTLNNKAQLLGFIPQVEEQLYIDRFDIKQLTKLTKEEVTQNVSSMSVSSSSMDNSFPFQNCVAVPPPLFKYLLSQTATSPLDCLLAVLRW